MSPFDLARSLLGPHAVLLPVKTGTKIVAVKGWPGLSLLDTVAARYRAKVRSAPAIAASLGPPSRDLIAIDFDDEAAAADFLALNPALVDTLRTRGARGCSLWAVIAGPYPQQAKPISDDGSKHLGEWRGGNCYSLITGQHPDGHLYGVLNQAPPTVIAFESIQWPETWQNVPALESADREAGAAGAIQKTASSIGYQRGRRKAHCDPAQLKHLKQLDTLYERFISEVWTPSPAKRNEFIVKAVPFLFHAMCEQAVMALVMRYYDLNSQLFKDSRDSHEAEAAAHLRNVDERFLRSLPPRERRLYDSLRSEKKKAALRICRHLSKRPSNRSDCGEGDFFLSYGDLGARLLMDPKGARKLMLSLMKDNVIEIVRNGERWEKGHRPRATWWRYLL